MAGNTEADAPPAGSGGGYRGADVGCRGHRLGRAIETRRPLAVAERHGGDRPAGVNDPLDPDPDSDSDSDRDPGLDLGWGLDVDVARERSRGRKREPERETEPLGLERPSRK